MQACSFRCDAIFSRSNMRTLAYVSLLCTCTLDSKRALAREDLQHPNNRVPHQVMTVMLTCMRRTAMPTALSSSVKKAAPRLLLKPVCKGAVGPLVLATAPGAPSSNEVQTSQATNSSSVRIPMIWGWLPSSPPPTSSELAVAASRGAGATWLGFACVGPDGVTTWGSHRSRLLWLCVRCIAMLCN